VGGLQVKSSVHLRVNQEQNTGNRRTAPQSATRPQRRKLPESCLKKKRDNIIIALLT
jgi:hypothetical protein